MTFSFKDVLAHVEQTLIDSIKELKRNKQAIRPETALYLFGLSLSSFFEDSVSDINISDRQVQSRLLDSFKLGWGDGITDTKQSIPQPQQQQAPTMTTPEPPIEADPMSPADNPNRLGKLPMPNTPEPLGGEPPTPEEEAPETLDKEDLTTPQKESWQTKETFRFSELKKSGFLNDNLQGVKLVI
jgi:hypothetical protein